MGWNIHSQAGQGGILINSLSVAKQREQFLQRNIRNAGMVTKPKRNARKCMSIYYKSSISLTCFGHSCGHPLGGASQRTEIS